MGKSIRLNRDDAPCKGCQKRVLGCHSVCEDYKKYHTEKENEREHQKVLNDAYWDAREFTQRKKKTKER